MRFAIVSDTHDNGVNFAKVISWLNREGIDLMLHCGDICNQDTIDEAAKNFKGKIKFVRGNGDYHLDTIPENMELTINGKKIFFVHYPEIARTVAESKRYDLVFYGHSHRPWMEEVGACLMVNPGELAGQRYKPTFAVYDTVANKLELKILENLDKFSK